MRSLLRLFNVISILNVAVFGPIQICQLLKPRSPTLQIVIIQVRLCCDRLKGAQRPSQWSSAFISIDLNGVIRRWSGVAVSFCNSSLNEIVNINTVGCRMTAARPDWIVKLWFDVLPGQETIGTVWVLMSQKGRRCFKNKKWQKIYIEWLKKIWGASFCDIGQIIVEYKQVINTLPIST